MKEIHQDWRLAHPTGMEQVLVNINLIGILQNHHLTPVQDYWTTMKANVVSTVSRKDMETNLSTTMIKRESFLRKVFLFQHWKNEEMEMKTMAVKCIEMLKGVCHLALMIGIKTVLNPIKLWTQPIKSFRNKWILKTWA